MPTPSDHAVVKHARSRSENDLDLEVESDSLRQHPEERRQVEVVQGNGHQRAGELAQKTMSNTDISISTHGKEDSTKGLHVFFLRLGREFTHQRKQ